MSDRDAWGADHSIGGELSMTETFVALFENMQEGVALHELVFNDRGEPVDYRIIDVNPHYETHTGLRRVDVAGKLASAVYGSGEAPYLQEYASVAMRGPPLRMDVYFQPFKRHFSISVVRIGTKAFATIFSDITLSKTQSEAIEKSRLSQRALLDNQPHLAWLKDRQGRFLAVNKAFAHACGQPSPEDVVGKTDLDVWPIELAELYRADDRAVMESGTQKAVEEQIANVDGTRWFETYKSPVFDPDGGIVGTTGVARDITERKRAEEARLRGERRLGQILDLAPDPIMVSNLAGELTFVNQAFCELVGYQRSEMLGQKAADLGVWEDSESRIAAWERLNRDGYVDAIETIVRSRDGTRHHVELAAALVEFDEATAVIFTGRDVTASRLAEEEAKKVAETLSQYFSLSVDLLCIANNEGRFIRLNPAWQQSLGYPLSELENTRFLELVHPEDLESTLAAMKHLSEGGRVIDFQNRFRHADESWRWIEWRLVPGGQGLIYAVARDITQRRSDELALRDAERAAARSRERLLSVSELAHIGHFTTDLSSGEVTWTPQLYRIFGRNSDQFQPTVSAVRPLIHAGDLAGADLAVTEARNSGQAQRFHIRVVRPNEEIRYCLAIVEVESNSALPAQKIHGLVQDLTELRRAEEERRKLEQQVMQSQKLESLGVLAGGIAHDFNNLLTVIAGNLDLAQLKLGEEHPEVLSNLRDAATAAIRARDLTHQLLTFAKGGKPLIELVDAGPVVREAAALAMTGSQNRLECNIPEGLWPAWADAGQVSQVVGNLIINANHATSQPGTIFVEAANYHLEKVGAGGLSEGDWVRVTVRDQGTGIAPEILPKIFDPFFTTKSSGSGLGLSSAHSIVLAHGGIIDVHSEIGKGTRFSFYLPAETGRTTAVLNSRPSPVAARPLTVLVLEDEEPVRRMLVRVLNMLGHNATAAADGEAAVELVADAVKRGSGFNLAILDLTIPGGLGGHAALKRMLTVDPTIKAIATSGYADDPVMANFEAHGFKGRLAKPYRIADLKEAISRAVQ